MTDIIPQVGFLTYREASAVSSPVLIMVYMSAVLSDQVLVIISDHCSSLNWTKTSKKSDNHPNCKLISPRNKRQNKQPLYENNYYYY